MTSRTGPRSRRRALSGGGAPSAVSGRRLYAGLVLLAALAIGGLGLYPHLRFSRDSGSLEYFFYSFDEGFYSAVGHAAGPGRALAATALSGLIDLCDGDVEIALIAADLLFPFLAALSAGLLAATVVRAVGGRLAVVLGLLFAAEYATHLFSFWIAPWAELAGGPWRAFVVEAQRILYLFRTPEPQISWAVAFVFLALLSRLGREAGAVPRLPTSVLFCAAGALLGLSYLPVLAGCAVYASLVCLALVLQRDWRPAAVLAGGILATLVTLGVSLLATGRSMPGGFLFSTSLPAASPVALMSLGMAALWLVRLAVAGAPPRGAILGALASVTPIILLNQQVLTGKAISLKVWEESSNHIFLVLGIAWFFATLPPFGRWPGGWWLRAGRQLAPALVGLAILLFAVGRQRDSVTWFYAMNAEEAAAAELLDEHYGMIGPDPEVLFDSVVGSQRLGIRSPYRYRPVLGFDEIYLEPVPALESDPHRAGAGSTHAEAVYEFMWRRGVTPGAFEAVLLEEAREHALVLTLFFSQLDAWGPSSTWRVRRAEPLVARIPAIVAAYREYRRRAPASARQPAFWVSAHPPGNLEAGNGLANRLVGRRDTVDGRSLYLYRQTVPPGAREPEGP